MKPTQTTVERTETATKGRRVDALEWLRAVHRRSELSIPARAVAAVLCARMDPDGASCFPSLATIASDAGYRHGRSVTSHLNELERGGWLIRERRPRKGRDHESTRYYATIPIDPPNRQHGCGDDPSGVVAASRQGSSLDPDNRVTGERHDLDSDLATDHAKDQPCYASSTPSPTRLHLLDGLELVDARLSAHRYKTPHAFGMAVGHRIRRGDHVDAIEFRHLAADWFGVPAEREVWRGVHFIACAESGVCRCPKATTDDDDAWIGEGVSDAPVVDYDVAWWRLADPQRERSTGTATFGWERESLVEMSGESLWDHNTSPNRTPEVTTP